MIRAGESQLGNALLRCGDSRFQQSSKVCEQKRDRAVVVNIRVVDERQLNFPSREAGIKGQVKLREFLFRLGPGFDK